MTHSLFSLSHASEQTLTAMVIGGAGTGSVLVLWVLFLIWRDKRCNVGRYKSGRSQRQRTGKALRRA